MKFGMATLLKEYGKMIIEHRASAVLLKFLLSLGRVRKFILPVNICPIVPQVFNYAKIEIKYVDINNSDYCIDYQKALKLLSEKETEFSGILFNHTYGIESTPDDFFAKIKEINPSLLIIDDRCLCKPIFKPTNNVDLTLFSTGYAKYVDIGYGGLGITNLLLDKTEFKEAIINLNTKLQINALPVTVDAYLNQIETQLKLMVNHKSTINEIYDYHLADIHKLRNNLNQWRYNLIFDHNSYEILEAIFKKGFFASKHYAPLDTSNYFNAQQLHSKVINLFNDKYISPENAEKLSIFLKTHYKQ